MLEYVYEEPDFNPPPPVAVVVLILVGTYNLVD